MIWYVLADCALMRYVLADCCLCDINSRIEIYLCYAEKGELCDWVPNYINISSAHRLVGEQVGRCWAGTEVYCDRYYRYNGYDGCEMLWWMRFLTFSEIFLRLVTYDPFWLFYHVLSWCEWCCCDSFQWSTIGTSQSLVFFNVSQNRPILSIPFECCDQRSLKIKVSIIFVLARVKVIISRITELNCSVPRDTFCAPRVWSFQDLHGNETWRSHHCCDSQIHLCRHI